MIKLNIQGWEIEVDLEKTIEYYDMIDKERLLSCCLYCKNYFYGIRKSSKILNDLFLKLGIVPEKAAHVSKLARIEKNRYLYEAEYLLTGEIITKPNDTDIISDNGNVTINLTVLSDSISFHFRDTPITFGEIDLCQRPILSFQLVCEIAWFLDELPNQIN